MNRYKCVHYVDYSSCFCLSHSVLFVSNHCKEYTNTNCRNIVSSGKNRLLVYLCFSTYSVIMHYGHDTLQKARKLQIYVVSCAEQSIVAYKGTWCLE